MMDEATWETSHDPDLLLKYLRDLKLNRTKSGRRKLRLFGCNCARRVLRLMTERGQAWLDLGERYGEGMASKDELQEEDDRALDHDGGRRAIQAADGAAL